MEPLLSFPSHCSHTGTYVGTLSYYSPPPEYVKLQMAELNVQMFRRISTITPAQFDLSMTEFGMLTQEVGV